MYSKKMLAHSGMTSQQLNQKKYNLKARKELYLFPQK